MTTHRTTHLRTSTAALVVAAMLLMTAGFPGAATLAAQDPAEKAAAPAAEGKRLQDLIDKAAPGSQVVIPKGTWTEPLTIRRSA